MGDPLLPAVQSGSKKFDGRLTGRHWWPFAFQFPTEVSLSSGEFGAPHHAFQIPQTFTERDSGATVQYDIILQINRGKLRADQK
jgi:hypothetical protein